MQPEFVDFGKIPRLSRECVITEKIDGTNAQVHILEDGTVLAGSRNRYITPESDNYGFAAWVRDHAEELRTLGPGRHFGEWWGSGIQRGYGLPEGERRFSLFNTTRWRENPERPTCCEVVPEMFRGEFSTHWIDWAINMLSIQGSYAAPGFARPEGIIVFHTAANQMFKKTLERDSEPKGKHS